MRKRGLAFILWAAFGLGVGGVQIVAGNIFAGKPGKPVTWMTPIRNG
jgi:hypothetical protein